MKKANDLLKSKIVWKILFNYILLYNTYFDAIIITIYI